MVPVRPRARDGKINDNDCENCVGSLPHIKVSTNHMPPDHSADVKFYIGRVLFVDIMGYSKLLIGEVTRLAWKRM